jgi:hypothetical protein
MKILSLLLSRTIKKSRPQAGFCFEARVSFFNQNATPHAIHVEPWGADYTLAANERFELVTYSNQTEPSFELTDDYKDSTQVWCNDADTYEVLQEGNVLECGHNRSALSGNA